MSCPGIGQSTSMITAAWTDAEHSSKINGGRGFLFPSPIYNETIIILNYKIKSRLFRWYWNP